MNHSPNFEDNQTDSTPAENRGGCFHLIFPTMFFALFFFMSFLSENINPAVAQVTSTPSELTSQSPNLDQNNARRIAEFFSPSVRYWENQILAWSVEWDLDPNLVATVMQIESCGDPMAESHAGAMGLFQVMPFHFSADDSPFDPDTNARRGLAYLRQSLDTHLQPRLAMAGYNGGITTAGRPETTWPQETLRYIYWGENIYRDASLYLEESMVLNEWLQNGGASLCAQAAERLGLSP